MIILPSRNGMLLRNSNGIISSDCGGPVAFTCPCELLEGDNSDCFDTDCTPSTYVLSWTGVQYCLDYVSGNTWSKTVGDIVVTLNLSSASETASITVVDNGTTVFSGTNTGTSCIHRWTGTMDNTVSPSSWGTVTYSNNCTQPEFSCSCTPETGDLNGAFTTNETPGTYIAVIDDHYYCLEYISDDDNWSVTVGDLTITLDLFASATTSSLTIVDDGTTVYLGYYTGTSGIHRWSGSDMANTIEGSDWETGSYYTNCNQTISPNCATGCTVTSGCSCYPSGDTPTKYYVVFTDITFCLSYVSGCTWQANYGDLTVTLNLTYSTNVSRLTITDGASTVFVGELDSASCANRMGGELSNTVSGSDWGEASYYPACSDYTCLSGRMLKFEILGLDGVVIGAAAATSENLVVMSNEMTVYGFTVAAGSLCSMTGGATDALNLLSYNKSDCSVTQDTPGDLYISFSINSATGVFNFTADMDYGWDVFQVTNKTFNWSAKSFGAYQDYANEQSVDTVPYPYSITCHDYDYVDRYSGNTPTTMPGTLRITIY